jgi:hypothetical protein
MRALCAAVGLHDAERVTRIDCGSNRDGRALAEHQDKGDARRASSNGLDHTHR